MSKSNKMVVTVVALMLAIPLAGQWVHRGAFITDVTDQLPQEFLRGRVLAVDDNGRETVFLVNTGTGETTIFRQTPGGAITPLISDNDKRLNGKLTYKINTSIGRTPFEHGPWGLAFKTYEQSSLAASGYFIRTGSAEVEPVAVAGETITATVLTPIVRNGAVVGYTESVASITVRSAGKPSVSLDGKRKYIFLRAQQPPNLNRYGIYVKEDGKFREVFPQGLNETYDVSDEWGIREDTEGRLWFVEIHSEADLPVYLLVLLDPKTKEKQTVYKKDDPILGEGASSISYKFDAEMNPWALASAYDSQRQVWKQRVLALSCASPQSPFSLAFRIPNEFPDNTVAFSTTLPGISKNLALLSFWTTLPENFFGLWDGEKSFVFLKQGDQLPSGNVVTKLFHQFGTAILAPATLVGCNGSLFTYRSDGSVESWLKISLPCIEKFPTAVNSDDLAVVEGQNFTLGGSAVEIMLGDTVVRSTTVANTKVQFQIPSLLPAGRYALRLRLVHPSGTVSSNAVTLTVIGPPPPPFPSFTSAGVVNGATFQPGISPGALASIFGTNLAAKEATATALPLPTTLGGVQVTFDGHPAPMWYVSPTQINMQVPCELGVPADVRVQVTRDGVQSSMVMVHIDPVSPGAFLWGTYGITTHQDYRLATPQDPLRPPKPGTLWVTGLGITNPCCKSGEPASVGMEAFYPISLRIDGVEALVTWAGLSPGSVGLGQINFITPEGVSNGVGVLTVNSVSSPQFTIPVSRD